MMFSKNGAAIIIAALSLLSIDIDIETANEVVAALTLLISFVLMIWNQVKRWDVKYFILKK